SSFCRYYVFPASALSSGGLIMDKLTQEQIIQFVDEHLKDEFVGQVEMITGYLIFKIRRKLDVIVRYPL
ncbi:MAG: hypothetical protein WB988_14710, partial [Candidatus Nitrosopolaris sp.]